MKIHHLSASQIAMATKCGQQYYYRYVEQKKSPPGVALLQGSACHKSREHVLKKKLDERVMVELGEAKEVASASLKERWAEGEVILDDDMAGMTNDQARGVAEDEVVSLAALDYRENLVPCEPIAVEEEITLVHPALPAPIVGVIDLRDTSRMIRDLKTVGKKPSQADVDANQQLTMYSMLLRLAKKETEAGVQLDCLVKTKQPQAINVSSTRTVSDIQVLLNRIARVAEMVDKELWMPAPVEAWWCARKWCGYWTICPYAAGRKRETT